MLFFVLLYCVVLCSSLLCCSLFFFTVVPSVLLFFNVLCTSLYTHCTTLGSSAPCVLDQAVLSPCSPSCQFHSCFFDCPLHGTRTYTGMIMNWNTLYFRRRSSKHVPISVQYKVCQFIFMQLNPAQMSLHVVSHATSLPHAYDTF